MQEEQIDATGLDRPQVATDSQPTRSPSGVSSIAERSNEAWPVDELLYYGIFLVVFVTPLLVAGLWGPAWGVKAIGVTGLIWFFLGYHRGGTTASLIYSGTLAVLSLEFCALAYLCKQQMLSQIR